MAKAASPIRLERSLMEAASLASKPMHRSAAEQIEYWADIGRKVSKVVDPDALLAINAGLVKLTLEPTAAININADDVFANLVRNRDSGALSEAIAANAIRYQASSQPGLLEQVHPDGKVVVGEFLNGEFQVHQA
jgi:ParD-like antitoxin of type II bacterial toxin-antitoxin system